MVNRLQYWWLKHHKPPIPPEVARDMEKVDKYAFTRAWIHDRTFEFWNGPYDEVYRKLKRKLILEDNTVYPGVTIEALFPLIVTLRETVEVDPNEKYDPLSIRVALPVIPRGPKDLPANKIRIGYGQTVNHFNQLFPHSIFDEHNIAPLNFTLIDTTIDPTVDVEIIKKDAEDIREEYVLEMNVNRLKGFYRQSKKAREDLNRRGYKIRVGEPITCYYRLDGLPGRRKEIPPVPLH